MAVGFVLITTHPGAELSVREAISRIEYVSGQWIVFGSHDLFVKVEAEDEVDLTRCVVQEIRSIEGIADTRTVIGAEI
mgnify:FL=1